MTECSAMSEHGRHVKQQARSNRRGVSSNFIGVNDTSALTGQENTASEKYSSGILLISVI